MMYEFLLSYTSHISTLIGTGNHLGAIVISDVTHIEGILLCARRAAAFFFPVSLKKI